MGNQIDWAAIPLLVEILGIADPASFVESLAVIRGYFDERRAEGR